jgi:hypothetical protein
MPGEAGRFTSVLRGIFAVIPLFEIYYTRWIASVSHTTSQAPQSVQSSPTLNVPSSFFAIVAVGHASTQSPSFWHFS